MLWYNQINQPTILWNNNTHKQYLPVQIWKYVAFSTSSYWCSAEVAGVAVATGKGFVIKKKTWIKKLEILIYGDHNYGTRRAPEGNHWHPRKGDNWQWIGLRCIVNEIDGEQNY